MSKWSSALLIIMVVVVGGLAYYFSTTSKPTQEETTNVVTFACANNKSITATFYPNNDTRVFLGLSDGRTLSVPHAISADGARYANADETFVFWNKGNTAFITEGASSTQTYSNCVIPNATTATSTPPGGTSTSTPPTLGVAGKVLLGPTCPVEQNPPLPQCADKGYSTKVSAYRTGSSQPYASTMSNANGEYALSLPAGSYTLSAQGGATLPRCANVNVTVDGTYVTQNISCDTGIR